MRFSLIVLTIVLTGCSMYTKSNLGKERRKSNPKEILKEKDFEITEYADSRDGYKSRLITIPIPMFSPGISGFQNGELPFYHPFGLIYSSANSRLGNVDADLGILMQSSSLVNRYGGFTYRFIYSKSIWRKHLNLESYKMKLGLHRTGMSEPATLYYGNLPMAFENQLNIRGGISRNVNFVNPELGQALNTNLKLGLSFLRQHATRIIANVKGKSRRISEFKTKGFYMDLSLLLVPDQTARDVVAEGSSAIISQKLEEIYPRNLMGVSIGYRVSTYGRLSDARPLYFSAETGINPGHFPNIYSRLYAQLIFGFTIGLKR